MILFEENCVKSSRAILLALLVTRLKEEGIVLLDVLARAGWGCGGHSATLQPARAMLSMMDDEGDDVFDGPDCCIILDWCK